MDPRVVRTRDKVLATTFELLYDGGLTGLTIDQIARRSGVAKTTIYRQWPNREALVLDACAQIPDDQVTPDTGTLHADVTVVVGHIGRLLWTARWSSVLPSIVDAAERDTDFAALHQSIQRGHAAPLREVLRRGAERGDLADDADHDALIAGLLGGLFYRRWFARELIDDAFVEGLVGAVLGPGSSSAGP